ncbi:histidine phosphatase superfamily [Chytridium lagenaria]|nr:histidine phosphatase superfamily [Chytridium lagenaria]
MVVVIVVVIVETERGGMKGTEGGSGEVVTEMEGDGGEGEREGADEEKAGTVVVNPSRQLASLREDNLRVFADAPLPDGLELKQLIFIHRHGERTPIHYTTSQHLRPDIWSQCSLRPFIHALHTVLHPESSPPAPPAHPSIPPKISNLKYIQGNVSDQPLVSECEPGQLTDIGKLNLVQLGKDMREQYAGKLGFLPEHLNAHFRDEEMYVRSTGYVRTIESVQYLLSGLFPLETREPGNGGSLRTVGTCPRLGEMLREFRGASLLTSDHNSMDFNSNNKSNTGSGSTPIVDFGELLHAYDLASCHLGSGLGLPPGIDTKLYADLEEYVTRYWWDIFAVPLGEGQGPPAPPGLDKAWGDEARKLGIGRFLADLKELLNAGVTSPVLGVDKKKGWWQSEAGEAERPVPKLAIFSGHDTTLGPLLASFEGYGGKTRHVPDFRANVAIELAEKEDEKASFMMDTWRWLSGGRVTDGSDHYVRVRLDAFMKGMEKAIPKNYDEECKPRKT